MTEETIEETQEKAEVAVKEEVSKRQKKEPPKSSRTMVRIVSRNDHTSLVQWEDGGKINRAYLPNSEVILVGKDENYGEAADPDRGVEYGDDLAEALGELPSITVDDFVAALHKAGIWHLEDAAANPNLVVGALNSVYRVHFTRLTQANRRKQIEQRSEQRPDR